MNASKLRHRIKTYTAITKTSPMGGSAGSTTWHHTLTLWASFEPLSVKDVINAQAADSQVIARCTIRYRKDINSKMRIEHRGRSYEIDGDPLPDVNSGLEYMTLMLKEVTNG